MKTLCLSLLLVAVCASVQAGEITGKVAAGKGISVVYVEAVAGKTFPPPDKPLEMDQKSLLFQPHILIGQAGSTVEFLNSESQPGNLAHRRKADLQIRCARHCAAALQRSS